MSINRSSRRYGGNNWNATQYFSGSDILKTIKNSSSLKFHKKLFLRNAEWFEILDTRDMDSVNLDKNITRAKRIAKMYGSPFFFTEESKRRFRWGNGWGKAMDGVSLNNPAVYFYEDSKHFKASMPMIEISRNGTYHQFLEPINAIRKSCTCDCLICQVSNTKVQGYASRKIDGGMMFSMKENSESGDFNIRYEWFCDSHTKQFLKRINIIDDEINEHKLSIEDTVTFIEFVSKRTVS